MVTLFQKSGVNSIFIVDEVVAEDKLMRDLYKNAGSRTKQKTIVITPRKAESYWDEHQSKEYNYTLIAKTVPAIYGLVKYGTPMKELNIGDIAQENPEEGLLITKSVYLNKGDAEKLKELYEVYGAGDTYFQATSPASKTSLKEALDKFNL